MKKEPKPRFKLVCGPTDLIEKEVNKAFDEGYTFMKQAYISNVSGRHFIWMEL